MQQLGFEDVDQMCEQLLQPEKKLRLYDIEIKFFTSLDGLDFAKVFVDCVMVHSNGVEVPVMSKPHLRRAKKLALEDPHRASRAAKDAKDLDILSRLDIRGT